MDRGDSAASARSLHALAADHQELVAEVTNLRVLLDNFVFDQQWVNQSVASLIEKVNALGSELQLLQRSLAPRLHSLQTSVDALHIRLVVIEQFFPQLNTLD